MARSDPSRRVQNPGPITLTAAALAEALETDDVLFVAADEVRAAAIAAALEVLAPDAQVVFCPGSDTLPGDTSSASPANAGARVAALHGMQFTLGQFGRPRIALVTAAEATARLYPAPDAYDVAPPIVRAGDPVDLAALCAELVALGYITDERVDEPGEIAIRGQVLDVFPADSTQPYRIEDQDGRIVRISQYDACTQRTDREVEKLRLGRVSEPDLGKGVLLATHLPDAVLIEEPGVPARRDRFLALAADAKRRRGKGSVADVATAKAWSGMAAKRTMADAPSGNDDAPPRFVEGRNALKTCAKLIEAAREAGERVVLIGSERDLRFLRPRLARLIDGEFEAVERWTEVARAAAGTVMTLTLAADRGFRRDGVLAIAAADLLGSRTEAADAGGAQDAADLFDLGDIRIGDVIVHEDHGIGVVDGLETLPAADTGTAGDAIVIRYAKDGRRLVPVADADRIWRYGADADAVTLDRLDGSSWQERRGAIDLAIAESAQALTKLAAERQAMTAPVLDPDAAAYERFSAGFAFTETPDQARAIAAVRVDLASGKPMDRLVVGDVGYGKTEVALRAAALVALAGHQVAIAAPTTVLARQHLESFTARFEGTGIVVAGLSRLSSDAEKRAVKAGLADGSIQVVVGTGAVAGKGVAYKTLALAIIDEEQRFGAADKARLRTLSAGHVLTMSATPIPRTLQTALVGLQQLSVIATPPARRQPIRTAVSAFDAELVRSALLREKSRGGQSFVVVPRIEDMAALSAKLAKLVPELEVLEAHGKMPAAEIDEAMVRFGRGDADILLATNIIEAGLDVPRANTMLVWHADRFGLSQLHQLRGRVGRGSRRGQILLLTDPDTTIAPRTLQRLRTLQAFDRLGAGFAISARDLDMRGAGDLIGEAQAGHMKLIGVDLYQHLLEGALRRARGEEVERWTPDLNLAVDGRLPETWIPDTESRVTLYARLSRMCDAAAITAFEAELEDRFGALPREAQMLLTIARIRAAAVSANVARIDAGPAGIALTPRRGTTLAADGFALEEKNGRAILKEAIHDAAERIDRVDQLLHALG